MDASEAIGWASSAILLLTLFTQVRKQWRSGKSEGVSIWLFIGQMAASLGFAIYSWMVGNTVFVFTNTLMVVNGLAGYAVLRRNRRREHAPEG
ncbi:MAG TPA: PQ-loop repeat-containing protein [Bryobacteraceae bacterium]|nr:PQ-loop repeat-containing protein [Bryobacteraceae bacterium]